MRKIKVKLNRVAYWFKVLNWARSHAKEVKDYRFLINLRKIAHNKFLKAERESNMDKAEKLKIQIKLIDKIIEYVKR